MSKEPDYTRLQAIAAQAEKLAPLTEVRFGQLAKQAQIAAGDLPQLIEFLMLYAPEQRPEIVNNLGDV